MLRQPAGVIKSRGQFVSGRKGKTEGEHVIGSVGGQDKEMWEGEGPKVEVKDKDTEVENSGQEGDCPGLRRED